MLPLLEKWSRTYGSHADSLDLFHVASLIILVQMTIPLNRCSLDVIVKISLHGTVMLYRFYSQNEAMGIFGYMLWVWIIFLLQALQALQRQPNAAQYFHQFMLQQQLNSAQLHSLAAVQQVRHTGRRSKAVRNDGSSPADCSTAAQVQLEERNPCGLE